MSANVNDQEPELTETQLQQHAFAHHRRCRIPHSNPAQTRSVDPDIESRRFHGHPSAIGMVAPDPVGKVGRHYAQGHGGT